MFETKTEIDELQQLLDESLSRSTTHLRSIVQPGQRALNAEQLVRVTTGMCTLALSTVTAKGEPRISGADGHFLRGRWVLGTDRHAAKARHLAARSGISVAYMLGEELGVFAHGHAVTLNPVDAEHDAQWSSVLEYLQNHYGETGLPWDEVVFYRVEPQWMVAYSPDPALLMAAHAASSE